jgi:hypothetical protein
MPPPLKSIDFVLAPHEGTIFDETSKHFHTSQTIDYDLRLRL